MLKLVERKEGKEKVWIEGNLKDIINWLNKNPDIYTWIRDEDPTAELPVLDQVENLRDLRHELEKADLSWWSLTIMLQENSMKNYLVETNADTQIWVTKDEQVIVFTEYELWKLLLKPTEKLLRTIGNFDEAVENNNNELEVHNINDLSGKVLAEYNF